MGSITVTKKIAGIAVFAALSFVVSFLEFPIFPAASFLKLDFSSVFTLLAGFIYGPVSGIAVCAVKELLCVTKSSTGGVGEIANFIVTVCFMIIPAVTYRFKKGFGTVAITLAAGCVLENFAALIANRFINFPLYMGGDMTVAVNMFNQLWPYIVLFNLIKTVAVSIITILLYKKVSSLIKRF